MRLVTLLGVMVLCAPSVRADEDPSALSPNERTERSRAHYERGRAHFNLGEYAAAVREFEEGYRWKPVPTFLFNIAQAARRAGQPDKALEVYRRYMLVGPKPADRKVVEQQIAELEKEIAARPPKPRVEEQVAPPSVEPPRVGPAVPATAVDPAPAATPRDPAPAARDPGPPAQATAPAAQATPAPIVKSAPPRRKWYRDWLAPTLLAAGGIVMLACGADFAVQDGIRGRAGESYQAHQDALGASTMMTVDAALMGAGGALALGGAVRWMVVGLERRF